MRAERPHRRTLIRGVLAGVGGFLVLGALLADHLGYGDPGSVGMGQVLLSLTGAAFILMGLTGRRSLKIYQFAAVTLVNVVVLLALVELAAIVVGRLAFRGERAEIRSLEYYQSQDWSESYWREADRAQKMSYEPYVIWRKRPSAGEYVNFGEDGSRRTPGASCTPSSYKVVMLGGSTIVGWGSPDWGTIPAYVQEYLAKARPGPVCVVNLGEDGYVSTQELVLLILELQRDRVPDAVVFYDGINDVLAAYESGTPGAHVTLDRIQRLLDQRDQPLLTWLKGTRTYTLIHRWKRSLAERRSRPGGGAEGFGDTRSLARDVVELYAGTYDLLERLASAYGFEHYFFLQPHPAVSHKPLTTEEAELVSGINRGLADLARDVYGDMENLATTKPRLWSLIRVFDQERKSIWIDDVGHVTPEGNRLIARAMVEALVETSE